MEVRTKSIMRCAAFGLFLAGFLGLSGCESQFEKITDPGTAGIFKGTPRSVVLSNANGNETTTFYDFETLFLDMVDLERLKQYCFEISFDKKQEPFQSVIVSSDSLGQVLNLPLLYDVGFDPVGNNPILPEKYEVRIQGPQSPRHDPLVRMVVPFDVVGGPNPDEPSIIPTDILGSYNGGSVLTGADLYARGSNFPPSTDVRIYVVEDRDNYAPGDPLNDVGNGFETVTTNANGELPNTLIWSGVTAPGTPYDIIGDLPPFGQYEATDALREAKLAAVIVQDPPAANDIVMDIASNDICIFQNLFQQPADDLVLAKATPHRQPLNPSMEAAVYVALHQDVWQQGDPLIAVANLLNPTSHEMPNLEKVRPLTGAKICFPLDYKLNIETQRFDLLPGDYDVIIDLGRNHVYDPGSDLLDGGPQIGFTVPGQIPEIRIFVSTDTDLLQPGASTPIYNLAVFQDGSPVVGARVTFQVVRGTGALSSAEAFTDANGLAIVTYFAGNPGDGSSKKVRSTFHINGEKFVRDISIRVKISLHDQGTLTIG